MLELKTKIRLDADAIKASNLAGRFDADDLKAIGEWCHTGYKADLQSRSKWARRSEAAMDLAMQIVKDKSFPWPGCANVAFPLVTIGVLQFHARAYPAIIQGNDVAKMRVIGEDRTGEKQARADRVSQHMSYQVMEEDKAWEEQHDRLLINVPCVGTAFTKDHYDPAKGYNCTELVLARDLVLDYWAKSVEECPRKTHRIPLSRNDIYSKVKRGTFRDVLKAEWYNSVAQPAPAAHQHELDNRRGVTTPVSDETTPFMGLEQHVRLDLDGDGYAEPYIITFEEESQDVLRIVTGFDREADIERTAKGEIIQIQSLEYFTKYGFIPSPDGGIMDMGFGVLLGPLNESVNDILNQMLDSSTMGISAGGFLGRGAKLKGGTYTFAPFQWQRVDASGDDLKKSIFPLPVRDPSAVMFQLLNLLIGYANRVSGAVDLMVGETPGQNTPAETSRNAIAEGEKIYSAIYKRTWRSMKQEFKKRYILNGIYMPVRKAYGQGAVALREDYTGNPDDVCPAADPNLSSDSMAIMQAQALKQAALTTAGYDPEAVERRYLKALKINGIEEVYPGPNSPRSKPPVNPKVQIEQLKQASAGAKLQWERQKFIVETQEQVRLNNAQIIKLLAEAEKLSADIEVGKANVVISAINAQVAALKQHNEALLGAADRTLQALQLDAQQAEADNGGGKDKGGKGASAETGGIPRMAGAPGDAGVPEDAGAAA